MEKQDLAAQRMQGCTETLLETDITTAKLLRNSFNKQGLILDKSKICLIINMDIKTGAL